ncbi:MAG: hypothetical protein AB8H80_12645 [Planctomycetota bacterium]
MMRVRRQRQRQRRRRREWRWRCLCLWLAASLASACVAPRYSPYPLDLSHELPEDAFARCRAVLLADFEVLEHVDEGHFRIQTGWQPTREPPGERRATIYRESDRQRSLAVVVEQRWLEVPLLGPPAWTPPRGDAQAERLLADRLRDALAVGWLTKDG